jgi:hypothetical protein
MDQVKLAAEPEITQPGGYMSMHGGFTGYQNHYYAMRPKLWKEKVGIQVEKTELSTEEPPQQGADPKELLKKPDYKPEAVNILDGIKLQSN